MNVTKDRSQTNTNVKRVLIVEDSIAMQEVLKKIFAKDELIHVAGCVSNGLDAVNFVKKSKPDLVTMDVNMPVMNGLAATRRIMETSPVPIIIISDMMNPSDLNDTFKALEAGAVAIISKPFLSGSKNFEDYSKDLCLKVKLYSEVQLVKRLPASRMAIKAAEETKDEITDAANDYLTNHPRIIGLGASTGGTTVIQIILSGLPKDFSIPIVAVQHMTPGFTSGLVDWLNETSPVTVKIAENGEIIRKGMCYMAPDNYHIKIDKNGMVHYSDEPQIFSLKPSISFLFRSLAENFGPAAVGILLTGMGRDGADELKMMRDAGALTIVQDKESSVVYGMPGEAVKLNAAAKIMDPAEIADFLLTLNRI
ncbi:MAG: chemotaxis-specific protein-glutamate methyltransferase CheB [Syntrophothermus sp.]